MRHGIGLVGAAFVLVAPLGGGDAAGAAAAPAATTIGATATTINVTCLGTTTVAQAAVATGASYTVPFDGVITSFSTRASATAGNQVRMILFGPPTAGSYPLRAKTGPRALIASVVNTYEVRVPVKAGWLLGGQYIGSSNGCGEIGGAGDDFLLMSGNPDADAAMSGSNIGDYRVNMSAVVEPDVDLDGFGDVSQDACPESALAQAACAAPETTITKKPKARTKKRAVTLAFTSTAPRSTFLVVVDGKKAKEMLSPFKTTLKPGKHKITVQAVSPLGIPDPTPAVVTFRVKPK
jgi:hypothetical protein